MRLEFDGFRKPWLEEYYCLAPFNPTELQSLQHPSLLSVPVLPASLSQQNVVCVSAISSFFPPMPSSTKAYHPFMSEIRWNIIIRRSVWMVHLVKHV